MNLDRKSLRTYGIVSALSIQLVASVVLGIFGGHWLDGRLHTAPVLLLVGCLLGLIVGMITFVRGLKLLEK
ncbi:MAG: AtpZ/AtpI family protein [Deltaproteobacteria bacterium]|nr:AtpZ/AtpI family protein [Deltaproteobacteria bacterium]